MEPETQSLDTEETAMARRTTFTPSSLTANGPWFKDASGRVVMLRGVNLSGNCKLPYTPRMPSHVSKGFFNDTQVSFVGRPFPLEEADEHFQRLHSWGFNFLRFLVTWEALEHAGPGQHDVEYMDYVVAVLRKAKRYGFRVFIDPHQDVWSRFSGGSGAPGWTLRAAGLNAEAFAATAAALVQNTYPDPTKFPKMIWATNYHKLAAATMFTLFFGGKTFAPLCTVNGVNIQDYLQQHYLRSIAALAQRIHDAGDLEDVVVAGYDTLNEPSNGWIGAWDLSRFPENHDLKNGLTPTPFQCMLLGEGIATQVQKWAMTGIGPQRVGKELIDPKGTRAWLPSQPKCIWAQHGVWDVDTRKLLKPFYFHNHPETGERIDFMRDFWRPFVNDYARAVRAIHPTAIIFVEPPVNEVPPVFGAGDVKSNLCYAPHWYDGLTLVQKHFNPWVNVDIVGIKRNKYVHPAFGLAFGVQNIRECFKNQLGVLRKEGLDKLGAFPCILGEIGIPFDMDDRAAYKNGDFSAQRTALEANMYALESNLLNFTLWNYCPDNTHEWGDGWNGEDLSLYCAETPDHPDMVKPTVSEMTVQEDPLDESINKSDKSHPWERLFVTGARGFESFVRPYPIYTPGTPVALSFDSKAKIFRFAFREPVLGSREADSKKPVEIYLPRIHFGDHMADIKVLASSGHCEVDLESQRVYWWTTDPEDTPDKTPKSVATRVNVVAPEGPRLHSIHIERLSEDGSGLTCPSCTFL